MILCLALSSHSAAAQGVQQFVGHIGDDSGAAIAGAAVTIHNEATRVNVVVQATGAGDYTAPYPKPGTYTITARMSGFQEVSKTHISLEVDQTSKMDFVLPVGNVSESVTISSEGSQIELSKSDRGEIIDAERVQELPLDGRNSLELFALSPGTQNNSNPIYSRQQDAVNQGLFANGITIVPVAENIDGLTNDNAGNYTGYNPPIDSISSFKVVLNGYDASYGRSAGTANDISLKSGTNSFHGDVYEFARRQYLDANSWVYDYSQTGPKANHSRDQFGAEVDGPVSIPHIYNGKDKTFFLLQWEQAYETLPNTTPTISSIPNPQWLTGNFAGAQYFDTVTQTLKPLIIYDPLSPLVSAVDPADGKTKMVHSPFPGNVIPQNRLDPTGLALAQYYKGITANYNPGPGFAPYQNNFYYVQVETDIARNGTVKIDHVFGPNDRGTIRWGGFERYDRANPLLPTDATHAYKRLQGVSPCVGYEDSDTPGLIHPGPTYTAAGCSSYAIVRQESNPNGSVASDYSVMQNVSYWGVRQPASHQFDASVSKRLAYNERINLQLRLDAINVLNHPNWTYGDSYTNDPTSTNWGTISEGPSGPGNNARELQISGKLSF